MSNVPTLESMERTDTADVNIHAATRSLCNVTDDIIWETKKSRSNNNRQTLTSVGKIKNAVVFMTGFTGDVGAYMIRSLLQRNNIVYCLIRDGINPPMAAQERFVNCCKRLLIFDTYYKENKIHYILGNYSKKKHLGISDNDWNFLCNDIDVVVSIGCRVNLGMSWSKAVNGILKVTNIILELCLTKKIKPLLFIASCGSRLPLYVPAGQGMCHGYALAKFVDFERIKYFYYTTKHPVQILFLGYLSRDELSPPSSFGVLHSLFWASFKLGIYPNMKSTFDYANATDVFNKSLDIIDFNNENNKLIYGTYVNEKYKKEYCSFDKMYELMKIIQPNLKLVSIVEFNKRIRPISLGRKHKNLTNELNDKTFNLMYSSSPSNNIKGIKGPNKEMLLKTLQYIHDMDIVEFRKKPKSSYFGYPWWKKVKINKCKL